MERLTREETVVVRGKEKATCNYKNDDCNDSCMYGRCRWQEKANMLLKQYEDTGLTPEQIMELSESVKKLQEHFGDAITADQVIDFFVDFYIAQGDPERTEGALLLTNEAVTEYRELKERDMPKKIEINAGIPTCPVCGRRVVKCYDFCPDCGQRLEQ